MPRRYVILATCCLSLFIVALDNTIVNVALPALRRDLGASTSGLQWTIDAYILVLGSLLVLGGSTADRVGRRRVFQIGLVVFTLGSLLCSLAPSLGWLIAFRALQAVGASMLNPVAMSIITNTFTDPPERARAIGVWGGVAGLSMAAGPVVGGLLVDTLGWRSIFWINIPIGVAAFLLAARFVPESRAPRPRRLDPVGQVLVLLVLAGVTYGIIEGAAQGWTSPEILACFAVGAASLAALLIYEPRRADPLIELRFFRSPPFSGATIVAVSTFAALSGFLFVNTIYLQDVRGLSPLSAGLHLLPMAAVGVVVSPIVGRVVAVRGARLPLLLGGTAFALAALPLTRLTDDTPFWLLTTCFVVFGLGFALVNSPITNTAVSGMPREQAGVAAAIASTSRQVGISLGVAVIGAVVAGAVGGPGFSRAGRTAWWIIVGLGVAIVLVAAITTRRAALSRAFVPVTLVVLLTVPLGYAAITSSRTVDLSPTGAWPVGRGRHEWVDRGRTDPFATIGGLPRVLSGWVWYPAEPTGGTTAAYAPGAWSGLHRYGWAQTSFTDIRTGVRDEAPPAAGPFPLVILVPDLGYGAPQYQAVAAGLASRGYVVAAITPTYSAALTVLSDRAVSSTAAGRDATRAAQLTAVWAADARFAARQAGLQYGPRVDVSHVVYAGHGLGGSAALEACRRDPACAGAAVVGGPPRGPGPAKPVLLLGAGDGRGLAGAPIRAYTSSEIDPLAFSDHSSYRLLPPLDRLLPSGRVDGGRAHETAIDHLVALSDTAVRGWPWPPSTTAAAQRR